MNQKQLRALICVLTLFIVPNLKAQVYTSAPYTNGFETNSLAPEWTTTSSQSTGEVTTFQTGVLTWSTQTAYSHTGNYFLGMHNATPGGALNLNTANLHLDMNGETGFRFGFWWADWNDEDQVEDGVFISDDGGATFVKVLDLPGSSYADLVYTHFDMSLDSINAVHGLTFTSTYVIRFQQYDDYYFAGGNDGFLIDDLEVYFPCNSSSSIAPTACSSYTTPSGNATYTTSGLYSDTIPNGAGCDSIISIDLTINSTYSAITPTACGAYTTPSGDSTYTSSAFFYDTIPNGAGCDSIISINLVVHEEYSTTITESACDTYTAPNGIVHTTSGIYNSVYQTVNGCDSIIIVDLTVNYAGASSITESVLDSYTAPSGAVYTTSGIYMDTVQTTAGCDSVITIDLTVAYTGLNEQNINAFKVYPNPTSGMINIDGLEGNLEAKAIYVFNTTGELVKQVGSNVSQIDLSELSSGVYFIEIQSSQGTDRIRILKK